MYTRDTKLCFSFSLLAFCFVVSMVLFPAAADAGIADEVKTILPKELYQPMKPDEAPELYGPTPSNAQLGNQGLSVQLRKTGTISVFAAPRPSMYNQIKMHTSSRDDGRLWGASENAGQFFGLAVVDRYEDKKCIGGIKELDCFGGHYEVKTVEDTSTTLLRSNDFTIQKQEYTSELNDVVKTVYKSDKLSLKVIVKDFIPINENISAGKDGKPGSYNRYDSGEALNGNAMIRRVTIKRDGPASETAQDGKADEVSLISFSNFNMTKNHHPYVPTSDWAEAITKKEDAYYEGPGSTGGDAVYHLDQDRKEGDNPKNIIGMAFQDQNKSHETQVGYDNIICTDLSWDCAANFLIDGSASLIGQSLKGAYGYFENHPEKGLDSEWTNHGSDCPTSLGGLGWCPTLRDFFTSTGLQSERLEPDNSPTENLILAAGGRISQDQGNHDRKDSLSDVKQLVEEARTLAKNNWTPAVDAKEDWYRDLLEGTPVPDAGSLVEKVSKRALVTLVQNYDPRKGLKTDGGGAIVASVSRQSPYGEDWPRDGFYFNYVLDHKIGLNDWVKRRNKWYADLQQKPDKNFPNDFPNQPLVPAGNWAMNYYGNGVEGGIVPWEIDETGYMVEAFWDHYQATNDRSYLRDIYPALKRSADFLVQFKDKDNNLQKKAHEDDHIDKSQTMVGAQSTWMGLKAAENAAKELGKLGDAERYRKRRKELGKAINKELWNEDRKAWGQAHWGIAEIVWPVKFRDYDSSRVQNHLESSWNKIEPTFETFKNPSSAPDKLKNDEGVVTGLYETKFLIALAKANKRTSDVKNGLELIADHWATEGTHIMGEVWMRGDDTPFGSAYNNDSIVTTVSQPHAWEQCLFYLAAINTYSTTTIDGSGISYGGYPGYPGGL